MAYDLNIEPQGRQQPNLLTERDLARRWQ